MKSITDHLGNKFRSFAAMCRHWGIGHDTVYLRLHKHGYTLEKALTKPSQKCEVVDHLGQRFVSRTAMCRHWGINYNRYLSLTYKTNRSLEGILTDESNKIKTSITDHLGNKFVSESAMCRHWKINVHTYRDRIAAGYSMKDALRYKKISHRKPHIDHLGNDFGSITAMCKHYHLSPDTFYRRIASGQSLKEVLTTSTKSVVDHLGNRFENLKGMATHYGIPYHNLFSRLHNGWSLERALTEPIHIVGTSKNPKKIPIPSKASQLLALFHKRIKE